MAEGIDFDAQLASISNELHLFYVTETETIRRSIKNVNKLGEDVSSLSTQLARTIALLDSDRANCLGLEAVNEIETEKDEQAREKIVEDRRLLDIVKEEQAKLLAEKASLGKKMRDANTQLDNYNARLNELEKESLELQTSEDRKLYKLLSSWMLTLYKQDNQGRCVSVILDKKKSVERAVLMDKENKPEEEVREAIWAEFDNIVLKE